MKTNTARNIFATFGFLMVAAMLTLMFFVGATGQNDSYMEPSIITGIQKTVINSVPLTGEKTINLVPFICCIAATVLALIIFLVDLTARNTTAKMVILSILSLAVIGGAIVQFFSLKMLPQALVDQWAREQSTPPTQEQKDNLLQLYKYMFFDAGKLKLDYKGIMSGAFGCAGGAFLLLGCLLGKKE